jgi:hypothetical protein
MDMTCRCKPNYTCVACKVKRGDYRDWMAREALRYGLARCDCGAAYRADMGYDRCFRCRHETVKSA